MIRFHRGIRKVAIGLVAGAIVVAAPAIPAQAASSQTTTALTVRAGPSTKTAALTKIPARTAVTIDCQVKGQAISGRYRSSWWARVTYNGTTGYASRAYLTVPPGQSLGTCPTAPPLPTAPPPSPGGHGPISRSEVIARAQHWVTARVPYSMTGYHGDVTGRRYRTDCSGMVSMAFRLSSSLTTRSLPSRFTQIDKGSLQPGDIVGNLGAARGSTGGHVVIFNGWVDASQTKFYALEQVGRAGANATTRTWNSLFFTKAAYRYNQITG